MGMTGGKNAAGEDMEAKFTERITAFAKETQGIPDTKAEREKDDEGKEAYNNGCAADLCCGHILDYGVWAEEYVCADKTATTLEDNRFQCYVDGAKTIVAGAMSVMIASFMMA